MLLECKNCGAPLDVGGKPDVVKCGYCGASASLGHLRTLNQETPKGWQRPREWRPPAHAPADSAHVYRYRAQQRTLVIGVSLFLVLTAVITSFVSLGGNRSVTLPDDGTCPVTFSGISGRHECRCGANVGAGSVWGTSIYTADSAVCRAARHAGAIGLAGGRVAVQAAAGCASYPGSSAGGITSSSWGQYGHSFYFVGHGDGRCQRLAPKVATGDDDACPSTFAAARLGDGQELTCKCSAAQVTGSVWGSRIYTTDSSVCSAAVHAGAMPRSGGELRAKPAPGCPGYLGSSQNGITTSNWGAYLESFYFIGYGVPECR